MMSINKYNFWTSGTMFILFIIMSVMKVEGASWLYGAIFGYIYCCFWNYIYNLMAQNMKKVTSK